MWSLGMVAKGSSILHIIYFVSSVKKLSKTAMLTFLKTVDMWVYNCLFCYSWYFSFYFKTGTLTVKSINILIAFTYPTFIQSTKICWFIPLAWKMAPLLVIFLLYDLLWNLKGLHKGKNSKLYHNGINANGEIKWHC